MKMTHAYTFTMTVKPYIDLDAAYAKLQHKNRSFFKGHPFVAKDYKSSDVTLVISCKPDDESYLRTAIRQYLDLSFSKKK
jgi:hypothetical protein